MGGSGGVRVRPPRTFVFFVWSGFGSEINYLISVALFCAIVALCCGIVALFCAIVALSCTIVALFGVIRENSEVLHDHCRVPTEDTEQHHQIWSNLSIFFFGPAFQPNSWTICNGFFKPSRLMHILMAYNHRKITGKS